MPFKFRQLEEFSCAEIAGQLGVQLIGCRAVNTAFDSGRIRRSDWDHVNGFAITPVITTEFILEWPVSHEAFCDEWWVFKGEIPADFDVKAFCNHIGTRIADYKSLDFEGACPLDSYWRRFQPFLVFGNNELGYVLSQTEQTAPSDGESGSN